MKKQLGDLRTLGIHELSSQLLTEAREIIFFRPILVAMTTNSIKKFGDVKKERKICLLCDEIVAEVVLNSQSF